MDSIIEETNIFTETLKKNISFYKQFWTKTYPTQEMFGKNTVLDRLPNERPANNPEYDNIDIKYYLNEHGFRYYPEFNTNKTKMVWCFGCSFTFGHGLPDNHTWPYLLAQQLGSEWGVMNFGKSAASTEEIARVFWQVLAVTDKKNYPDAVYFYFPDCFRTKYIGNDKSTPVEYDIIFSSATTGTYEEELEKIKNKEFEQDIRLKARTEHYAKTRVVRYGYTSMVDSFFRFVRFFKLIKFTAENRNIPWYWSTWGLEFWRFTPKVISKFLDDKNTLINEFGLRLIQNKTKSRDNTHCGLPENTILAKHFAGLYKLNNK